MVAVIGFTPVTSLPYNLTAQSYSNLGILSYYKHFFRGIVILKASKSAVIFKTASLMQGILIRSPIYELDYNACQYHKNLYTE